MIWRLMDTYDLIKDIEGPFTAGILCELMLARGMDPKQFSNRYYQHLSKLVKQGYLKRIGEMEGHFKKKIYIYEVIRE